MENSINKAQIVVCASLIFFSFSCGFFDQWIDGKRLEDQPPESLNNNENDFIVDFPCIPVPRDPEYGLVTKVIDGDSIVVRMDGGEYEVRYIGINAPEFDENSFDEASLSKRENQELVEGKEIILFRDVSNTDRYGRLLRYVFLDDLFINLELIERGFAQPKSYPPDIACQQLLNSAGIHEKQEN